MRYFSHEECKINNTMRDMYRKEWSGLKHRRHGKRKSGFAGFGGDAGVGKTKAIEHYISAHPTNTVMVTVNECFARSKSLLGLIADTIGAPHEKSMDAIWRSVVNKMSDGMLLIVDESQHLSMKTVDMLRR